MRSTIVQLFDIVIDHDFQSQHVVTFPTQIRGRVSVSWEHNFGKSGSAHYSKNAAIIEYLIRSSGVAENSAPGHRATLVEYEGICMLHQANIASR